MMFNELRSSCSCAKLYPPSKFKIYKMTFSSKCIYYFLYSWILITQKFNKKCKFHNPGVGDFVLVRENISHVVKLHLFLTRRGWGGR